ncbi:hypothetical protein DFH08DRAFT_22961 [Mycena albidolilacea]|uniref:PUB domain-containing protein n=1 Tax=Mycena albidolilacea TaxID=1033008 RepID=A0AAD7AUK8_9AGAR|nr:hypothetical protein DFH08DRAFT_22961 [Mycena albidolilacea]
MSESPTPSTSTTISADLAAAAERRLQQRQASSTSELQFAGPEHEQRQKFRRLLDPGILRPNAEAQALASLKTLLTISENLLRDFENPRYRQFKPTNATIKRNLMDPKGTVEYARELGFYPEVQDFQPYYTFNPRKKDNLRIGAEVLKAQLDLLTEKEVRAAQAKKDEKAAAAAVAEKVLFLQFNGMTLINILSKVRLAYEDDRKMKLLHDELEKERRDARIAAAARRAATREAAPEEGANEEEDEEEEDNGMPGTGNVLGSGSLSNESGPSNNKGD